MAKQSPEIKVVDIDAPDPSTSSSTGEDGPGESVWFKEIGVLSLPNGSMFHVTKNRLTITDTALLSQLRTLAKNPATVIIFET